MTRIQGLVSLFCRSTKKILSESVGRRRIAPVYGSQARRGLWWLLFRSGCLGQPLNIDVIICTLTLLHTTELLILLRVFNCIKAFFLSLLFPCFSVWFFFSIADLFSRLVSYYGSSWGDNVNGLEQVI